MMSCRTVFYDWPDRIQSAGGRVDRLTGVCHQRNYNAPVDAALTLDGSSLDWVTGANLLVSPAFLDRVGLMREDYFLYYEEVDWAFRRGEMPIVFLPGPVVYHRGGTAIGSGTLDRRPSPFSNYFNHRNRIRFARRFLSRWPVFAYLYGLAKAVQLVLLGSVAEAHAVVAGMFELPPPRAVEAKLHDANAAALAFGRPAP
jgi:GT2 family glycosyltransferase